MIPHLIAGFSKAVRDYLCFKPAEASHTQAGDVTDARRASAGRSLIARSRGLYLFRRVGVHNLLAIREDVLVIVNPPGGAVRDPAGGAPAEASPRSGARST